jgi:hypothetical protein
MANTYEQKIKEALIKAGEKYGNNFYFTVDISFNSCINEARDMLGQNNSPLDYELWQTFNAVVWRLTYDISSYTSSSFSEARLEGILKDINDENKDAFDDWFLTNYQQAEQNYAYIGPIERRLKELLEEKRR